MFVDVLPALLPAALVLLIAAVRPHPHTLRATAWTLAATAALILTALAIEENTTTGTTVLAAGFALAALAFVRGHLICLAAAPAAAWSIVAGAPLPGSRCSSWAPRPSCQRPDCAVTHRVRARNESIPIHQ